MSDGVAATAVRAEQGAAFRIGIAVHGAVVYVQRFAEHQPIG